MIIINWRSISEQTLSNLQGCLSLFKGMLCPKRQEIESCASKCALWEAWVSNAHEIIFISDLYSNQPHRHPIWIVWSGRYIKCRRGINVANELYFAHEKSLEIPVRMVDKIQLSHLINMNYKESSTSLVASISCTLSSSRARIERNVLTDLELQPLRTCFK